MTRPETAREAVLVFVKHPEPGMVKTRLAASLGARRAARVYRRTARLTLDAARQREGFSREIRVCVDPPHRLADAPAWLGVEATYRPQSSGDLGERMRTAFADAFTDGLERVVLVGSDCPSIEARDIDAAFDALGRSSCVLGPATDGGYWLIGLARPRPEIFDGISWSTPAVLQETRERLRAAGVSWGELRELRDLDTADDLLALAGRLPASIRLALGDLPRRTADTQDRP